MGDDLLGRTALGTDTRNQEEIVRTELADLGKLVSLGGSHYEHHILRSGNGHHLFHNYLIERLSILLGQLEVSRRLVGRKSNHDSEFAFVLQERSHGLATHIRRNGDSVEIHGLEEGLRVHLGSVSDIAAFCVSDEELLRIIRTEIVHCLFEGQHSVTSVALVEGQVRLVSHAMRCRSIDYGLVELIQ